jgi:hypothetical protein
LTFWHPENLCQAVALLRYVSIATSSPSETRAVN